MIWRAEVSRDITLMPIGDRWYRIPGHFSIDIWGPFPGRKHVDVDDGFEFDGRSGPGIADVVAPNLGEHTEELVEELKIDKHFKEQILKKLHSIKEQ